MVEIDDERQHLDISNWTLCQLNTNSCKRNWDGIAQLLYWCSVMFYHLYRGHEFVNSGFPSERINLSPFTKDFRGGEQLNESWAICFVACFGEPYHGKQKYSLKCKQCISGSKALMWNIYVLRCRPELNRISWWCGLMSLELNFVTESLKQTTTFVME